jgi:hypothetical protein
MATVREVLAAYQKITDAEERYRATLRRALAAGIPQVELAQALGLSREKLRQDTMTETDRERIRQADAARKRRRRATTASTGEATRTRA